MSFTRTAPPAPHITVVAFGGNALAREGERGTQEEQVRHAREACRSLIPLLTAGTRLLITYGNGPQVGHELIRVEEAREAVPLATMDVRVASTQGSVGYLIEQALRNDMAAVGLENRVATLVSQVLVDPADPGASLRGAPRRNRNPHPSLMQDQETSWALP